MNSVIVVRHVPFEGLGHIQSALEIGGLLPDYRDIGQVIARQELERAAALILMGGPMSVNDPDPWVVTELRLIEQALSLGKPILGICLGSQLLAKALGATVRANPVKEIGWFPITFTETAAVDPVFGEFRDPVTTFHWHGETFDIPTGAVRLASSERCLNQAFRYGDRAYGLQFHPEVTPAMIAEWLAEDANCGDVSELTGPIDPHEYQQGPLAAQIFHHWTSQIT